MARGGRRTSRNLITNVEKIREKYRKIFENKTKNYDVNGEMISKKIPIHFGGISDPFANNNISNISKKLLEVLHEYDYPTVISTKNPNQLINDKTIKILKDMKNLIVQISLSTSNERELNKIEPNTSPPKERIKCIARLINEDINVIIRLQPLFVQWIDEIRNILIPKLGSVGCSHIVVEHLKLPVERNLSLFCRMLDKMNWNAYEFYKKNKAILVGREWILPNQFKWNNLQPIVNKIHDCEMSYGSGDYGLNHLGDTNCCCGIDKYNGFSNWFKGNFSNIIKLHLGKIVTFEDIERCWFPSKSIKMYMNSNCRLPNKNDILSHMRRKWNSPGTVNAPDSYLGVFFKGEFDEHNNCVYEVNKLI